jgi:ABC-2 type transport system permease protein
MAGQFGGGPPQMNVNMEMIRPLLSNTTVLILFLLPMVTMRTYSEEKKTGTIELLLTSPLKDAEIILGKFLGAMGMYLGLLVVTAVYMSILFVYGNPALKPLLSGYLGLVLFGGCFVAMGLFISSLTSNQMVAGAASSWSSCSSDHQLVWETAGPRWRDSAYCRSRNTSTISARV